MCHGPNPWGWSNHQSIKIPLGDDRIINPLRFPMEMGPQRSTNHSSHLLTMTCTVPLLFQMLGAKMAIQLTIETHIPPSEINRHQGDFNSIVMEASGIARNVHCPCPRLKLCQSNRECWYMLISYFILINKKVSQAKRSSEDSRSL